MGEGRKRRMMKKANSVMIYFIYCKNFCKCYNIPPAHELKKKKPSVCETAYQRLFLKETNL
jgi:hypothetical protein